ncbi:uncharacterized protein LOC113858147 [Abrus precatorius]|uniref:Uncharacterized protein LOC113858147 n=1 Tax=Abrus precatorius TaxID=3816 RepID=A0A8B8KRC6_ABRPR|nr:uncharacterized protein LOC113858147 [Abrus precatorius]
MTDQVPEILNETLNPNINEQCEEQPQQQQPHIDPQSPKTLLLSNPPIQSLPDPDPHSPNPNLDQDTLMQDSNIIHNVDDNEPDAPTTVIAAGARRGPKRKKLGAKRTALEKKSREKLQVLVETLKPVPFVPAKALDFESHQSLLQRLGLWDFVRLEFDTVIRGDLIAQLIASYVPNTRCSYVNGVRIFVNRADLGRALKLPKKTSASASAAMDGAEVESSAFVEDLVYNWMLLHDDAYIMGSDVLGCLNLIKEGNFEKVDWAGLIWNMVEKELKAPQLESCYYASHLQLLIKTQHKELFEGEAQIVGQAEVKDEGEEEEEEEEEEVVVGDEVDASGDVNMGGVDEGRACELAERKVELNLMSDSVERVEVEKEQGGGEQLMDFDQAKEEEPAMWLLDPKNSVGEPFLRPCHGSDVKGVDCEEVKEEEGEDGQEQEVEDEEEDADADEDEHEGGFHLSPKCIPLEGMTSGNGSLIQAMEAVQMPFTTGIDLRDNTVGDFLSSRDEPQMISGSSLFGNGHKRDIGLDNHNSHPSLNGSNKRLRSDSPWNSKPMDFEMCMEQLEHWMGKARMMYATKDQACEESTMNQQVLLNELQKRDNVIDHLHKTKMEEAQKRQMEVYRLEKELFMMQSLVDGYRKALKDTQKAFAEYRARCPQADEPLYKDVPGSGGLVLSVMELEKERQKKEEEERAKLRDFMRNFEEKSSDFESTWFSKFEGHMSIVESLGKRLLIVEGQVKHLNEVNARRKVSDPIECAPTSEGETAQ